jgi:hypothetical protein
MYLDKDTQRMIANCMLHVSLISYSTAEDIEDDFPERAQQLKDVNEATGYLFNLLNPKKGTKIDVHPVYDFED